MVPDRTKSTGLQGVNTTLLVLTNPDICVNYPWHLLLGEVPHSSIVTSNSTHPWMSFSSWATLLHHVKKCQLSFESYHLPVLKINVDSYFQLFKKFEHLSSAFWSRNIKPYEAKSYQYDTSLVSSELKHIYSLFFIFIQFVLFIKKGIQIKKQAFSHWQQNLPHIITELDIWLIKQELYLSFTHDGLISSCFSFSYPPISVEYQII